MNKILLILSVIILNTNVHAAENRCEIGVVLSEKMDSGRVYKQIKAGLEAKNYTVVSRHEVGAVTVKSRMGDYKALGVKGTIPAYAFFLRSGCTKVKWDSMFHSCGLRAQYAKTYNRREIKQWDSRNFFETTILEGALWKRPFGFQLRAEDNVKEILAQVPECPPSN